LLLELLFSVVKVEMPTIG